MQQPPLPFVRKNACEADLAGVRCIRDDEILTNRTDSEGIFRDAPRWPRVPEDEVSAIRGAVGKQVAAQRMGQPAHLVDVAKMRIRQAVTGELRLAGFAVIHTPGRKGHGNGHVSIIWPDANPLDEREWDWPAPVRKAFAACFTEQER